MAKYLFDLLALLPNSSVQGKDCPIETITADSREVQEGALFICLKGSKVDGHDYIRQAHEAGAAAVLVEQEVDAPSGLTVVRVSDTRRAMQIITPHFYDNPGRKMRMIGITGTNGKTTTTHLIRSILIEAGYKVGLIGTIHTLIGEKSLPVKNTTPDVIELQSTLAAMVGEGVEYVVMEVSSHALELGRVAGCEFDVAVFTNLTRDHLDFHHTFENYALAKAKLFSMLGAADSLKEGKTAIVNADDSAAQVMLDKCSCKTITYGISNKADLVALDVEIKADGASFAAQSAHGNLPLCLKITGMFNVYNVLAAIGVALAENISPVIIKKTLESFDSVPGRFELVDAGQPFSVIVDYAHTPDGLENILKTAKQFAEGNIIVVFGCGGDRDRTKRPIMGRLAVEYGNIVIATSDNPRTEDPETILKDIEVGIYQALTNDKKYDMIVDRYEAIKRAISLAEPRDIVIIAGKGHETYQILKDKTIPFDDREVARSLIREMR